MIITKSSKFFGVYDGIIVIVETTIPMNSGENYQLCNDAKVPFLQKCFLSDERIEELNLKQMYFYEYVNAYLKTAPRGYSEQ